MKKINLTKVQYQTLEFLRRYIKQHGDAPTMKEIATEFELDSLRSVTQRLETLERKGYIKRNQFQQRSIALLDTPPSTSSIVQVPIIASAGCDATEVYAQELYDEFASIESKLIEGHGDVVILKAVGNSMVDAGINNGDYVLVEVTQNVASGDRVAAIVDDKAVIKRLRITPVMWVLEPESKIGNYGPIFMGDNSKIFGKVLSVVSMSEPQDYELKYEEGYKPSLQ